MKPDALNHIIAAAMTLLPASWDTPEARRMLRAIAYQETDLKARRQHGNGPARSYWQFELGGGCRGVLTHVAVRDEMRGALVALDCPGAASPEDLWRLIEHNDVLAAAAARCLLYTLPHPMATTQDDGWQQYIEAWRPGKPHPEKWADAWERAA